MTLVIVVIVLKYIFHDNVRLWPYEHGGRAGHLLISSYNVLVWDRALINTHNGRSL